MTSQHTNEQSGERPGAHASSVSDGSLHGRHSGASVSPASDEVLIRKKRRRNTKRRRALRIVAIVAVVLVVIGSGSAFAVWNAVRSGEQALHQTADATDIQTADNSVTYDEGRTVQYNGHTYALNENMVSVVVMGYDRTATDEVNGQNGQADAVMVMALDTSTGKVTAIGIPRDSMVDVSKSRRRVCGSGQDAAVPGVRLWRWCGRQLRERHHRGVARAVQHADVILPRA